MPLVKFFVIVILLACMHSCGKYPADGGSADTDKLYAEGMAELKENQYNKALSKLLRYVQIEERNSRKDTLNLMKAYYNVGGIYSIYSDFAQALELYKKGYALGQASDNDEMQFKFLTNMIGASCYISKPELADGLNENLLRLKGISKGRRMYYYYFNKGFIAGSHGDYDGKARWMEKAIAAADRYGLPDDMKVYAYSEVYQCYENRGDLYKALSALKTYESIACDMNQMYLYTDCYKGLMRIYTKLGDKENALHYQKEYFRYNDSLLNINEFSRIKTDYEVSEDKIVQATIDNLEKINSLQKIVLSMLLALGGPRSDGHHSVLPPAAEAARGQSRPVQAQRRAAEDGKRAEERRRPRRHNAADGHRRSRGRQGRRHLRPQRPDTQDNRGDVG